MDFNDLSFIHPGAAMGSTGERGPRPSDLHGRVPALRPQRCSEKQTIPRSLNFNVLDFSILILC
jgi:hypothetical protein